MPKGLKRIHGLGHLHFITFSCYRRLPLLRSPRASDAFLLVLDRTRHAYGFNLVGYVVMPEHVHLLVSEPARGTPSTVLKVLKQQVSRRLSNARAPRPTAARRSSPSLRSDPPLPRFWQQRFYDFNVWSRKKKIEKLAYMHTNPVKRGLVQDPGHWPWSSYTFYQQRGQVLIDIDPVE